MLYSVQQASKILNISRVTIYKKIESVKELKPFVRVKNKTKFIDEKGLEIIRQSISDVNINKNQVKHEQQIPQDKAENVQESSEVNQVVNLLKEQIDLLNEQIKNKDIQLERMQVLLLNNQKLLESRQDKEYRTIWQWLGIRK